MKVKYQRNVSPTAAAFMPPHNTPTVFILSYYNFCFRYHFYICVLIQKRCPRAIEWAVKYEKTIRHKLPRQQRKRDRDRGLHAVWWDEKVVKHAGGRKKSRGNSWAEHLHLHMRNRANQFGCTNTRAYANVKPCLAFNQQWYLSYSATAVLHKIRPWDFVCPVCEILF
jgi:hypothetical protein